MVHEVAIRGFGREAQAYERSRPSYPPDAVAWLVHHLQVRPGAIVADLAAGTRKLTRLLLPTGAFVLAMEPVHDMRQVLHQLLPDVPTVAGSAEAMPLRSSSLDAVTPTTAPCAPSPTASSASSTLVSATESSPTRRRPGDIGCSRLLDNYRPWDV